MRKLITSVAIAALLPAGALAQGRGHGGGSPPGHGGNGGHERGQAGRDDARGEYGREFSRDRRDAMRSNGDRGRLRAAQRGAPGLARAELARLNPRDRRIYQRDLQLWREQFGTGRDSWHESRDAWRGARPNMTRAEWFASRSRWMEERNQWQRQHSRRKR